MTCARQLKDAAEAQLERLRTEQLHARDVTVKRAQVERCPLLVGFVVFPG